MLTYSVACFEYKEEAEKFLRSVKKRLSKFKLKISEEKTKLIEYGRFAKNKKNTFDFLGFTHYNSKSENGKYRTKRKTNKKKFRVKIQEIKKWLRERMHNKVSETIKQLNIKILGHYRYYGITDNTRAIRSYYNTVNYMFYKILNRRTQKNKHNYKWYYEKIGKQIERPKIYVDIIKKAYSM